MADTTSAAPSLLACPFCGSPAETKLTTQGGNQGRDPQDTFSIGCSPCGVFVHCINYPGYITAAQKAALRDRWNCRTPQPVAHTYAEVVAAWNAQADEFNQWIDLAEDEKIEWAMKCAQQLVAREPLPGIKPGDSFGGCPKHAMEIDPTDFHGIKKGDSHA